MSPRGDEQASSSHVQQEAEVWILEALAAQEGLRGLGRADRRLDLDDRTQVEVDGCTPDRSVLVEAYARQGELKGAQLKKISQDVLKLALIKRDPRWADARVIIAFTSQEAHDSVTGWLRHAAEVFGVELLVVEDIPDRLRERIRAAQQRQ